MKKIIAVFILLILLTGFFVHSCYFAENKKIETPVAEIATEENDKNNPSKEARAQLEEFFEQHFPADDIAREKWVDNQMKSFEEIRRFFPEEVPIEVLAMLKSIAEANYPNVYTERLKFLKEQTKGYENIESIRKGMSRENYEFAISHAQEAHPDDFPEQATFMRLWRDTFMIINAQYNSQPDMREIVQRMVESYPRDPSRVLHKLLEQNEAKEKIAYYYDRNLKESDLEKIKNFVAKRYPSDYIIQERALADLVEKFKKDKNTKLPTFSAKDDPMSRLKGSIFTVFAQNDRTQTAVLAKVKDKLVILCSKDAIPENFPAKFSNSIGEISCSSAYVSNEFPVVIMIPDEIPAGFKAIEAITEENFSKEVRGELFMIAPNIVLPIENLFEEIKDSRISAESAPVISSSEKLMAIALRVQNPDPINLGTNFRMSTSGNAASYRISPRNSSMRSVKITDLKTWKALNLETFKKQELEIKNLEQSNNDFLLFFKKNTFKDALSIRKTATIAERNRRNLQDAGSKRDLYERHYRQYMLDINHYMRNEVSKYKNTSDFYTVFKDELEHQLKLRESMCSYVGDAIKESSILKILHTDLKQTYQKK